MKNEGRSGGGDGGGGVEVEKRKGPSSKKTAVIKHTVDGDGNDLSEGEAVGTLESRDLAERVELGVLSVGAGRVGDGVDQLDVEVVVLGSDQDRDGASVLLLKKASQRE